MMKKILLPLFLGTMGITAHAQIDNGNFESWTETTLFQHPNVGANGISSNYDSYFESGDLSVYKVLRMEDDLVKGESTILGSSIKKDNYALRIERTHSEYGTMEGYYAIAHTAKGQLTSGIPITDNGMTGLSMDMFAELDDDQQGAVVVQFMDDDAGEMEEGQIFDFPFSSQSEWSTKEFSFDEPISESATHYVIFIATFNPFAEFGPNMTTDNVLAEIQSKSKNSNVNGARSFSEAHVIVDNIKFVGSTDVITGGDFQSWADVVQVTPQGCYSGHPFETGYIKSTDAFSGHFALELKTQVIDQYYSLVGNALMGLKNDDFEIIPTIALGEHKSLSFQYSYDGDEDQGLAIIRFFEASNSGYEEVFSEYLPLEPTDGYANFTYDFANDLEILEEEEDFVPTFISIEFVSSIYGGERDADMENNTLLIDKVAFPVIIKTVEATDLFSQVKSISAFPNPTQGDVTLQLNTISSGTFDVYNQSGALVATRNFEDRNNINFDLNAYPAGLYTFKINSLNGVSTARVINQ